MTTTIYELERYDGRHHVEAYFDPTEGAFVLWPEEGERTTYISASEVSGPRWTVVDTHTMEEHLTGDRDAE